jgi:hypothetical protein
MIVKRLFDLIDSSSVVFLRHDVIKIIDNSGEFLVSVITFACQPIRAIQYAERMTAYKKTKNLRQVGAGSCEGRPCS